MEYKIYMIEVEAKGSDDYTDDEYMTLAEQQGTVYSIKGFQDAFNYSEDISTAYYIRIIKN